MNIEEIEISIIIPHYNTPNMLGKLLSTIPNKKEIEVIVIDDKSNVEVDVYKKCVEEYSGRNIHFINNTTSKKGAGVCRNLGLTEAKGKWLLFADADDFFLDDFYLRIKPFFSSKADIVYFVPKSIELDTGREGIRHVEMEKLVKNYFYNKNRKNELDLRYRFIQPVSKLIKRNLVVDNEIYFEEIKVSNDCMFSTKTAYYAKNIEVSLEEIYNITRAKGTLTTQKSRDVFYIRLQTFIRCYQFLMIKLAKDDFKILNLHGRGYIWRAIANKYSINEIIEVWSTLHRNGVKLFDKEFFNVKNTLRKFGFFYIKVKREKKHYEK